MSILFHFPKNAIKKERPKSLFFYLIKYALKQSNGLVILFILRRVNLISSTVFSLKGGDPAAPSDTATLLWLHPSQWFYLRRLPPLARLAHRLWVPPSPMAWQAVCTRPENAFTPTCWFGITSNSGFMWASCSPQSELRLVFWGWLHITALHLFVPTIVARL